MAPIVAALMFKNHRRLAPDPRGCWGCLIDFGLVLLFVAFVLAVLFVTVR